MLPPCQQQHRRAQGQHYSTLSFVFMFMAASSATKYRKTWGTGTTSMESTPLQTEQEYLLLLGMEEEWGCFSSTGDVMLPQLVQT